MSLEPDQTSVLREIRDELRKLSKWVGVLIGIVGVAFLMRACG
jgi:hypothetical protein